MRDLSALWPMLREYEGLRLKAYPDPGTGGYPWTIGYGTTVINGIEVRPGQTCTKDQAEEYMKSDAAVMCKRVEAWLTKPVTDNQMCAILSLAYNIGLGALHKSRLLADINSGHSARVCSQDFMSWCNAGGHFMEGLAIRRHKEMQIFLTPEKPAPKAA